MKSIITAFFLLVFLAPLAAQDQHFTQFFASPLTLNPALTGALQGKYRLSFIYRDQWRQALEYPYSTFSVAADFRYPLKKYKRRYKDAFGVGLLFYTDRVPSVNFSTNQMMVSGAFHKALDARSAQYLSVGFQLGIAQRNVSYASLSFEDEFNGNDGYNLGSTGEALPENNFAFGDLQLGINYSYAPERGLNVYAGAALHHVTEPELSFFFDAEAATEDQISSTLYRKYSGYLNLSLPLGESVRFSPRALVYAQGPHAAFNGGANFRFLIDDLRGTALHLGAWARPVRNQNDFTLDSAIGMVGIEYNNFLIGFSYDIGLDELSIVRRTQGAFEISVAYLGEYEDDAVLCPKF